MTQWMQFINLRPGIILIDTKGSVHPIREPESMNSVTASERVPDHLRIPE